MAQNPYAEVVGYTDQPWGEASATPSTEEDSMAEVVAQVRAQLQQQPRLGSALGGVGSPEVESEVLELAVRTITTYNSGALSAGQPRLSGDRDALAKRIVDEILGWGPLAEYMRDPRVEEVLLNDYDRGFVLYAGGEKRAIQGFAAPAYARQFFNRKIEAGHGYPVNTANPYQDARLPDGSRLFVQVPPVAGTAIQVAIRRFRPVAADLDALVGLGTITPALRNFLDAVAKAHITTVVSGGTGTGKTTFLQALSRAFPRTDRVVTIEDTPELQLEHLDDWVMSYVRHAAEGITAIGMGQLVRNALRQRPTRIILGEARGAEMVDILTAANTGHDGTLFTVHANSAAETTARMVTMYRMGRDLAPGEVRREIVSAVRLIVHLKRAGGLRYVAGIGEVRRIEGEHIVVEELFASPGLGKVALRREMPQLRALLEARVPGFDYARDVVQAERAGVQVTGGQVCTHHSI